MEIKILSKARRPRFTGAETISWADVSKDLDAFIRGFNQNKNGKIERGTQVGDLPQEVKDWIANKTLLGDPSADTFQDLVFFPVVNPATDSINSGGLRAVLSGRGAQAKISKNALNSARNMAQKLLDEVFPQKSLMFSMKRFINDHS